MKHTITTQNSLVGTQQNKGIAVIKTGLSNTIVASATAIALSISSFSSAAGDTQHTTLTDQKASITQAVGLGSGVVIGAAVAGPLGAVVAGIIGAFVADDVNNKHRLADKSHSLSVKETQLRDMQIAFNQLKQQSDAQLAAFDEALESDTQSKIANFPKLIANVQFKTASFLIEEHYQDQLSLLAKQLTENPALKVVLSGFADQRGDSNYNQILSEQRNASVKNYLMSKRVHASQIITQAFGESQLLGSKGAEKNPVNDRENNFFDRRVVLKVTIDPSIDMTAATHTDM